MATAAPPDDLQLTSVLLQFGLQPREFLAVSGGFSGARVWRVQTTTGQLMGLRLTAAALDRLELERRESICRWMQFARANGCAWAPQPICPQNSAPAGSIGHCLLRQPEGWWQVEAWMPGRPVDDAPSPVQLHQALAVLARLHQTGRTWARQESQMTAAEGRPGLARAASPGLQRRLHLVRELQSGELTRLLTAAALDPDSEFRQLSLQLAQILRQRLPGLARQLEEFAPRPFSLQPVLRDLWSPHLLFSGDQVTGVIDWNAASADHQAFDYSRLLASWYGWQAMDLLSAVSSSVAASAVGRLLPANCPPEGWTPTEHQLLRICVEASLLLSPVTWLHRRCAHGPATQAIDPHVLTRYRHLVLLVSSPGQGA
ncbi:MAG: phosphotransferase [Planctomycetota bacterium]